MLYDDMIFTLSIGKQVNVHEEQLRFYFDQKRQLVYIRMKKNRVCLQKSEISMQKKKSSQTYIYSTYSNRSTK